MNKNVFAILIVSAVVFSCNSGVSKKGNIPPEVYSDYLQKGNEISGLTQGVLLANVGKAIQQGGPEYAVEFCNLKVSAIVDSLNQVNKCVITRVSEKNRNPDNTLQNEVDKNVWAYYSANFPDMRNDTLIQYSGELVYYKPISIALPTCLKCHGNVKEEINQATAEKLEKLYPDDLATGYKLNDLRGMWKIKFK